MSTDENKAVVRRFITEVLEAGNLEVIDQLLATDYVNSGMGGVDRPGFKGMLAGLVAALPRPDVEGLRWTTRDQWHITLRFFGAVELEAVSVALRSASAPATTAVLGPETGRFGKRVLHVPVSGLDAVAKAVVRATKKVGKPPEPRPFTGHLTLARARDRRALLAELQARTRPGGEHVVLAVPAASQVIPLGPEALQSEYGGWQVTRRRRATAGAGFIAVKSERQVDTAARVSE